MSNSGMATSGCCCQDPAACVLATDDFNRANSTNLGANWSEEAGDGAIASNKLSTSSANAVFIHQTPFPDTPGFGFRSAGAIEVTVFSSTTNAQAILFGGWQDANNYIYIRWTFGATDATLELRYKDGGLDNGAGTFTIPARGAGVETRLRLCWGPFHFAVTIVDVFGPFTYWPGVAVPFGEGAYAGVGTGVTGGAVTFDDYEATETTATTQVCDTCPHCPYCPEDQEICLRVDGFEDYDEGATHILASLFNGDWVLPRGGSTTPGSLPCYWDMQVLGNAFGGLSITMSYLYSGGHFFLTVEFRYDDAVTHIVVNRHILDLGTDLIGCDELHCEDVPFSAGEFPAATVSASSGDECCGYYEGAEPEAFCCHEVELPAHVYVTVQQDGVDYANIVDEQLDLTYQVGEEFRYDVTGLGLLGDTGNAGVLGCNLLHQSPPPADACQFTFTLLPADGSTTVNVTMSIESCDPFHAVGSLTTGGHTYDVEVIE